MEQNSEGSVFVFLCEKTGQNYDEIINKAARSQQSGKEFTDLAVRVKSTVQLPP